MVSGDYAVKTAFMANKVKFLFVARDASADSQKKLLSLAENAGVRIDTSLTANEIGSSIGKEKRISAALLDDNFLNIIK